MVLLGILKVEVTHNCKIIECIGMYVMAWWAFGFVCFFNMKKIAHSPKECNPVELYAMKEMSNMVATSLRWLLNT